MVGFATLLERRGHRSELFGGRGALTRALEVAGGNVNREQVFTQLSVCRIDLGRLTNHFDGVGLAAFLGQFGGELLQLRQRRQRVAEIAPRPRRVDPRCGIVGIEGADADADLRHTGHVAPGAAALADGGKCLTRFQEKPLLRGHLRRLEQRQFVVRLDLEDLLVECAGLGKEAFGVKVFGDADVLLHGFVDLPAAHVKIAERIRGIPVARMILDDADIFRNGLIELPLAKKLLGVA